MMRAVNYWAAIFLCIALGACASHQGTLTVQTVGPDPRQQTQPGDYGWLVVFTAWNVNTTFLRHVPYFVTSADGKIQQPIQNQADVFDQRPSRVEFSPGKYHVIAQSENFGRIDVPVAIEKGRTTIVYLDSDTQPRIAKADKPDLVRLPDGSIAGWAADAREK